MTKYVFITGGVVSSLGKGLAMASLGALLQARGYKVRLRKLDPYLNVDPGTMSPIQHGEVFVTEDGAETDLDLGHYERFTGIDAKKGDNITTGKIYSTLLKKERRGDYLGGTVQVIPHVTDLIKDFILNDSKENDFLLCEIGGTVGDIEGLPFFETIRQIGYELGREQVAFIHLTLLPYLSTTKELKTKPTQHSVKELRSIGIQPNILLCRAEKEIPKNEIKKIALFCNLKEEDVIPAIDAKNIYEVPIALHEAGLDTQLLKFFKMNDEKSINLDIWKNILTKINKAEQEVRIGIVGKYIKLSDAYKSLIEALHHACVEQEHKLVIKWINSRTLVSKNIEEKLLDLDGIIVPGGFGDDGIEGKIHAIEFARTNKIPFLGICLGMQLSMIEIARHLCNLPNASSTEFGECDDNVVGLMTEWKQGNDIVKRTKNSDLGGTMRLGSYDCMIKEDTLAHKIYNSTSIKERHRHRYEVNINYKDYFEKVGVVFSGMSPDGNLPEIMELKNHPWFVGVQFHPELKSKPFSPHPLFCAFIKASINEKSKI